MRPNSIVIFTDCVHYHLHTLCAEHPTCSPAAAYARCTLSLIYIYCITRKRPVYVNLFYVSLRFCHWSLACTSPRS